MDEQDLAWSLAATAAVATASMHTRKSRADAAEPEQERAVTARRSSICTWTYSEEPFYVFMVYHSRA